MQEAGQSRMDAFAFVRCTAVHDGISKKAAPLSDHPLLEFNGRKPEAPAWFSQALDAAPATGSVTVRGARLETLSWGREGAPGLLFLHGLAAHADWWSFIAPFFSDQWRVAPFSWSGMGGSDWRDSYDLATHAEEILEVAGATGLYASDRPPIVVGHSFGASPLIYAASTAPDRLRGGILIDCHFRTDWRPPPNTQPRPHRLYPSLEATLARFRFTPPQTCSNPYITDFLARGSVHKVDCGWTWRFDPSLIRKLSGELTAPYLATARAPLILMAGTPLSGPSSLFLHAGRTTRTDRPQCGKKAHGSSHHLRPPSSRHAG